MTFSGRFVTAASVVIGIELVFEASTAPARQHEIGAAEHVLLRGRVLADRLDHQVGSDELIGRRDTRKRLVRIGATLLRKPLEAAAHRAEPTLDRTGKRVVQGHATTRRGDHLSDAAAHLPGADDEDMFERHGA